MYISLPSAHDSDVKVPIFTFCGGREKRLSFFFLELRYSQSRIVLHKNLLTFDELYQGGKISAIRFESARNHFLRDVFVAVAVAVVERVRERGVKLHQVVHEV